MHDRSHSLPEIVRGSLAMLMQLALLTWPGQTSYGMVTHPAAQRRHLAEAGSWGRAAWRVLTFTMQIGQTDVQADVNFSPTVLVWVIDVQLVHTEGDTSTRDMVETGTAIPNCRV